MQEKSFIKFLDIESRTKYFAWVLLFLSLASIAVFAFMVSGDKVTGSRAKAATKTDPFANIGLEAKAVVVWDVVNQHEIFAKNSDLPLPLASLTKVMTVVTASDMLPKTGQIQILSEYLQPEGDSKLVVGDSWAASDLIDFTLVTSSNDGALALAAVAESLDASSPEDAHTKFVKKMNETAEEIGLSNSKFWNEHGLDQELDRGGAYGSAKDMALLFQYTMNKYPDLLEATRYKSLALSSKEAIYDATNTNTFVDQIPGLLASKTGYTELAGGNLVIAFDAPLNRPIIISVLGSTADGRFTDTLKLVEATMKYIHAN